MHFISTHSKCILNDVTITYCAGSISLHYSLSICLEKRVLVVKMHDPHDRPDRASFNALLFSCCYHTLFYFLFFEMDTVIIMRQTSLSLSFQSNSIQFTFLQAPIFFLAFIILSFLHHLPMVNIYPVIHRIGF